MKRKLLSVIMALAMMLTLLPATAFAADETAGSTKIATEKDLTAAIAAAQPGDTVTLTGNIDVTAPIVITKELTLNLGGNMLAVGSRYDGTDFRIGIQKPFAKTGVPIAAVSVSDRSVVTSGDYERYFEKDGVIYHHILDPDTGYPIQNDLDQVTVISDESVDGDALSTTCYALGLDEGMELIRSLDDVEAVFVTKDGEIHRSSNAVQLENAG